MVTNKKNIASTLSVLVLALLLMFIITEGAILYKKHGTINPVTIQKELERNNKKEVTAKEKNPNECLYSGCGNFY